MANNYCHLSYEDRKNIEDGLNENKSINQIAIELGRSHSTILREVDRNKIYYNPINIELYQKFKNPTFDSHCNKLDKPPHVCNGCKSRSGCRKERYTYYARKAHDSYSEVKSEARKGIDLTEEELFIINENISPLIKKGQTINHLYINHPDILNFSKSTFYNYIKQGVFDFGPLDLPRMVRYKKRINKKRRTRKEREIRINRTHEDFIKYVCENNSLNIVEMDTVEGLMSDSKCLLTLFWRKSNFMLIFLLESQTSKEVTKAFNFLQETLDEGDYKQMFQVILTDNGSEFFDVLNIECLQHSGEHVTKVFYCDPGASWQKGGLEKNHEFIRYVLPKKTSFENLTQEKCNILANNINSLCRESLNNKSPFEATKFICDNEVLHQLSMKFIEPNDVHLNTKLLK